MQRKNDVLIPGLCNTGVEQRCDSPPSLVNHSWNAQPKHCAYLKYIPASLSMHTEKGGEPAGLAGLHAMQLLAPVLVHDLFVQQCMSQRAVDELTRMFPDLLFFG